jgi:hypothetical protein
MGARVLAGARRGFVEMHRQKGTDPFVNGLNASASQKSEECFGGIQDLFHARKDTLLLQQLLPAHETRAPIARPEGRL